ncbi:unnamed protein product [Sphagnum balticum]
MESEAVARASMSKDKESTSNTDDYYDDQWSDDNDDTFVVSNDRMSAQMNALLKKMNGIKLKINKHLQATESIIRTTAGEIYYILQERSWTQQRTTSEVKDEPNTEQLLADRSVLRPIISNEEQVELHQAPATEIDADDVTLKDVANSPLSDLKASVKQIRSLLLVGEYQDQLESEAAGKLVNLSHKLELAVSRRATTS